MSTLSLKMTAKPEPAETFDYWWQRDGEWVEPPNQRRGGESGVKRIQDAKLGLLYLKRQIGHLYRSLRYPLGRPTVLRERDALTAFTQLGVAVPELVYCEAHRENDNWKSLLVTRALAGFEDLKNWYAHGGRERAGADTHEAVLRKIGASVAKIHRHHWQHSCLHAKHIFLSESPEADGLPRVALLDLEKCRRRWLSGFAARCDLKQLRRHSPMWSEQDWRAVLDGHREGFGKPVM